MSYIKERGFAPTGVYYSLYKDGFEDLVKSYVKKETGLDLNLSIGCYDSHPFDVFIRWDDESEENSKAYEKYRASEHNNINNKHYLLLSPHEWFHNRDIILEGIFGSKHVACEYFKDEEEYTVFIYSDNRIEQNFILGASS